MYTEPSSDTKKGLDVLINVYNSELEKRSLEGYRLVELDHSVEPRVLQEAPSEKTLNARTELYRLLDHVLGKKLYVSLSYLLNYYSMIPQALGED